MSRTRLILPAQPSREPRDGPGRATPVAHARPIRVAPRPGFGPARVLALALLLAAGALLAEAGPRADHAERAPEARAMVQLRDRWFILNPVGRGAVDFYYRYSPYAAFAIEQEDRDGLKELASLGMGGLRGLFRSALLWMPAAGALVVLWLAALASHVLGARARRHAAAVGAAAAALFLTGVAADWFRPAEIAKRAHIAGIRAASERGEFPPELVESARHDPDPDVRYEILYALAERPADEDRAVFREALGDADLRVRSWALNGIGNLPDRDSLPAVLACLSDPVYNIRYRAAWALGRLGDPAGRRPLEEILAHDEHIYVRYYAAEALDRLVGDKKK